MLVVYMNLLQNGIKNKLVFSEFNEIVMFNIF